MHEIKIFENPHFGKVRTLEIEGLFEIKETAIPHSDGHITVSLTPKVSGKGQKYFVNRFLQGVKQDV